MTAPPEAARLAEGYRRCAALTRRHGTTYYWGAAILPRERRRHVHAVYALCRMADDIVDAPGAGTPARRGQTRERLAGLAATFQAGLAGAPVADPALAAAVRSIREVGIDAECFDRFFAAMGMDLTRESYATWEDLLAYMEGSAAVIGEMMLPVLGPAPPVAKGPARDLGLAFQLTNFLRDIGEDLGRDRVYVPREDLDRFGVDPAARRVDDAWRALLAFEIERNRALYASADRGIRLLPPASARCVGTARVLYARILDRIEANDYDVFTRRAAVPTSRKALLAARAVLATPKDRWAAA